MTKEDKKPNRGPSKSGKHPITIHLSDEETALLTSMAESQCRSLTQQARFFVLKGLNQNVRPTLDE